MTQNHAILSHGVSLIKQDTIAFVILTCSKFIIDFQQWFSYLYVMQPFNADTKIFFFAHKKNKKVAYFMAHRHNGVVDTFGHILFHRNDSPWDLNLLTLVYALSTINIEFLMSFFIY